MQILRRRDIEVRSSGHLWCYRRANSGSYPLCVLLTTGVQPLDVVPVQFLLGFVHLAKEVVYYHMAKNNVFHLPMTQRSEQLTTFKKIKEYIEELPLLYYPKAQLPPLGGRESVRYRGHTGARARGEDHAAGICLKEAM
jgi:hypothetical protein